HQRDVHDVAARVLGFAKLLLVHRSVGAAEVVLLIDHLGDAIAGAGGRIINLDAVGLVILGGPFLHHWSDKRRAAARDTIYLVAASIAAAAYNDHCKSERCNYEQVSHACLPYSGDWLWRSQSRRRKREGCEGSVKNK